jgi:signal recognition particle subunit SRP54
MFQNLSDKLSGVLKTLGGKSKLSEDNISDALTEVRKALLSADVHFKVAREFCGSSKECLFRPGSFKVHRTWSTSCKNYQR